ncbi:hypothetical protein B0T25DRAFT_630939 [Lasiosphaeria hispida]|uniref:Apple domain-containing protein n=1 Tax=Lasiosphaeria hispida TaxID=260671 RepID=A0AAJ0HNC0_9PEZI|nr:hypothetical protein B0T25DRAFT_630939 [Lasiosphaeria hispida]
MRTAVFSATAGLAAFAVGVQGLALTTTTASISYLTIPIPKPTASIDCFDAEAKEYGLYTSLNGKRYRLQCQIDFVGNDIAQVFAPDYASCAEACSVDPGCLAFSYLFGDNEANCFLKNPSSEPTATTRATRRHACLSDAPSRSSAGAVSTALSVDS